jgi:hypothetical protein
MMKKMLLIGLMIMTTLCVFGCSQPVVEEAVEEEAIEDIDKIDYTSLY